MYKREWKTLALEILNNWFLLRKSMYFIAIKDIFYCNKKMQIMIKYQCLNKRIGDIITLEEYMSSPLKHATYPDQLFQIGIQTEKLLNDLKVSKYSASQDIVNTLTRFKRVFYFDDK